MSKTKCRVCKLTKATLCNTCGPNLAAEVLTHSAKYDRPGLRQVEARARDMMAVIDSQLPPGWGAVIFFTQLGQKGYASYVSTVGRSALPTALREFAALIEERSDRAPGQLGVEN